MCQLKRVFDLFFSLILLAILALPLCILACVIRLKLGSPVLFKHLRPGLNGRPFQMIKFRTMTNERDYFGVLFSDEQRLNSFGRFLRSMSLDELPELINVFKGEMSFVGPRPLLMSYLERYSSEQARRHEVRPGITGLAQVSGRNAISWEEKFNLDVWYIDHWSFWLDLKILFLTIFKVFKREGVSSHSHATMSEFLGAKKK